MAATSIADIRDFHDIIRLLEEHPEWRADLRRVLLTDELLELPRHLAQLAAQMRELVEAQRRTETQLAMLTDSVRRMGDDLGTVKGRELERTYREKAAVFFDTVLQEPRALSFEEVRALLDDGARRGVLSAAERRELGRADLIIQGKHLQTGEAQYLVVEVSWGVRSTDVERAAKRAALLRKLGLLGVAVVAGEGILPEAHQAATEQEVWQVIDGSAIAPPSVRSS
jgi:hypothetical protein